MINRPNAQNHINWFNLLRYEKIGICLWDDPISTDINWITI